MEHYIELIDGRRIEAFPKAVHPNGAAHIDDVDSVGHVDFPLVHVIEHLLCPFGPHLIIARMAKQADANDDVASKGQALLCFQILLLELCAAAEGYYFVFADHNITASLGF